VGKLPCAFCHRAVGRKSLQHVRCAHRKHSGIKASLWLCKATNLVCISCVHLTVIRMQSRIDKFVMAHSIESVNKSGCVGDMLSSVGEIC